MTRTPYITLWVNGKQVSPEFTRLITSLNFNFPKNKAATGTLVFKDTHFEIFDSGLFNQGQRLGFMCGWRSEMVSLGPYIVKSFAPDCPDTGDVTFTVEFQDKSHLLNKKQKQKKWLGKPEVIIKNIARCHGLAYDIDSVEGVEFTDNMPLMQSNNTDAALLQRLASRYGYSWSIKGNTLTFKRPNDLESAGVQKPKEVPVLQYRQGDFSILSFSPEVRFSKGGRRKNAKKRSGSLDLLGDLDHEGLDELLTAFLGGDKSKEGSVIDQCQRLLDSSTVGEGGNFLADLKTTFSVETVVESVKDTLPMLGEMFGISKGQKKPTGDPIKDALKETEAKSLWFLDAVPGKLKEFMKAVNELDEDAEETDTGDVSGAATPTDKDEAARRNAGALIRASQTIEGSLVPSIASMHYVPSMTVILAGLGKRLSGKYEVLEVDQEITPEGFTTILKVMRRQFYPAPKDLKAIAEAEAGGGTGEGAAPVPGATDPTKKPVERLNYLDALSGKVVRKTEAEVKKARGQKG